MYEMHDQNELLEDSPSLMLRASTCRAFYSPEHPAAGRVSLLTYGYQQSQHLTKSGNITMNSSLRYIVVSGRNQGDVPHACTVLNPL